MHLWIIVWWIFYFLWLVFTVEWPAPSAEGRKRVPTWLLLAILLAILGWHNYPLTALGSP